MLNRAALVVRLREPFVRWINEADPSPGEPITSDRANADGSVFLVDAEDEEQFDAWLALNHSMLFETLLNDWYTVPELWPPDRSLELLREWCELELHTVVLDTGGPPLEDDEL